MKKRLLFLALSINFLFGYAQEQKSEELVLSSEKVKITWNQLEDGWHVQDVYIENKPFSIPAGYYTLIYLNRNPAANLVDLDIEGKAFTFYPSKGEVLADGSVRFMHSLRFGDMEAIWKIDPDCPEDIKVSVSVKMKTGGSLSISSPTLVTIDQYNLSWGMIPGNWYGTEVQSNVELVRRYSMGIPNIPILAKERSTMTLCPNYCCCS